MFQISINKIKPETLKEFLDNHSFNYQSRELFWSGFINHFNLQNILEIGVFNGEFSSHILRECSSIQKYYMIDSWRHLDNWNKPCNLNDEDFNCIYADMKDKTEFAKNKRIILKGKTAEKIDEIRDNSLDFVYIDGDHTLKGITMDLLKTWDKVRKGGMIAGDDFTPSIWQHSNEFEPSFVFPYAVYFAEALSSEIYGLPHNQFLIQKSSTTFKFHDISNKYHNLDILSQIKQIYK